MGFWKQLFGTEDETGIKKNKEDFTQEEEVEEFECENCGDKHPTEKEAEDCCEKFKCVVCKETYYDEDEAIDCCVKTYKFNVTSEIEIEVEANTQEEAQDLAEDFDEHGEELWDEAKVTFIERVKDNDETEEVVVEKTEEPVEEVVVEKTEEPVEEDKPKKEVIRKKKKEE